MVKEKNIESKIVQKAKELGFYIRKYETKGVKGSPDRIVISPHSPHEVFFIEFKSSIGKIRPSQHHEKQILERFEKKVYVVNCIEDGIEILMSYL